MKDISKRLISTAAALTLVISVCIPGLVLNRISAEEFSEQSFYIDYSEFDISQNNAVPNPNSYWSVAEDPSAAGGRYLRYAGNKASWKAATRSKLSPTGANAQAFKQQNSANYSVTLRYKISGFTESSSAELALVLANCDWGNLTSVTDSENAVLIEALSNTDGWVEETVVFTSGDYFAANDTTALSFFPHRKGDAGVWVSSADFGDYEICIDYIRINRVAALRLNNVNNNPVEISYIYGVPGDKAQLPAGNTYYASYDAASGELSDVIDADNYYFEAKDYVDLYYFDTSFEEEKYVYDFSRFKDENGNFPSGSIGSPARWELIADPAAVGGCYLSYYASERITWRMTTMVRLSTDGTSANMLRLPVNTGYRVKVKYRVSDFSASEQYNLSLALVGCHSGTLTSIREDDLFVLEGSLDNTGGWIEKTYFITTPESFTSKDERIAVYLLPCEKGSTAWKSQVDFGKYRFDLDYIEVERSTKIELVSDGEVIDSIYGVPGEVIDASQLEPAERNGYRFTGWYIDEDCTVSADKITLTNHDVSSRLYAGWVELMTSSLINDETYPDWRGNSAIYSGFASDAEHKNGTSSFKTVSKSSYMLLNKESLPFIIADKNTYQVSFWYKSSAAFTAGLSASGETAYSGALPLASKNIDASGEWKRAVITFTAEIPSDMALYFTVSGGTVYIDDISISTESKISFVTNNGSELEPIFGTPGTTASLPVPVYDGHTFSGWFIDQNLSREVTTVIFPTDSEETVLYAGWDIKDPWALIDFENAAFLKPGWWNAASSYNQKSVSIITDEVFAGNKSMKFDYKKGNSNTSASQSVSLYKDDADLKLKNGVTYMMTFWYKPAKLSSDVSITAMTAYEHNFYAGAKNYDSNCFIIRQNESGGDWSKGTIVFTADCEERYRSLFLRINPLADSDTIIYFDNIAVDPLDDSVAVITYVLDSTNNQMVFSKLGEQLTLPSPSKEGYAFKGWYEDSEYKTEVPGSTYTVKGHANLYAKWALSYVNCDFEQYPDSWINKDGRLSLGTANGMSLSTEESYSGRYSVRYLYSPSNQNNYSYAQIYNINDITVTGDNPLIVEDKSSYKVTLRYKVAAAQGNIRLRLVTAGRTNYWANRAFPAEYYISSNDAGAGWKTATIFFTADILKENFDALYIDVTAGGGVTDVYFDDFVLESMDGRVYIAFNPNNGGNTEYQIGMPGETIKYPADPAREGHTFMGWYLDKEYTQRFTGTRFGTSSVTVYAKLQMNDNVIISFEDAYLRQSLSRLLMRCTEISDERASHGKYSLKLDKADVSDNNAVSLLTLGELPVRVENNTTYVLTYDYYIEKGSNTSLDYYTPWPNVWTAAEGNMWAYRVSSPETWRFPLYEQSGVWKTASTMFTTDFENPQANVLYFSILATERTVMYFDNLRLTRIENDSSISVVNLNPTGATSLNGAKLIYSAKAGDRINLPTNISREGYIFTGWYTDAKCTDMVINNEYNVQEMDVTLYAGWAAESITQNFETMASDYYSKHYKELLYYHDEDFELYDSEKAGSDVGNVHGGKYSMHKIGNDHHNGAFQVVTADLNVMLSRGQVYNISMWVKMDSSRHTDGAIAIASSNYRYPWGIDGDWKNIVAIEDLKDGEWHKVDYTFYSTSSYFSVRVPGYCSIYFDDIEFEIVPGGTAEICSTPVEATEYIAQRMDADSELPITEMELDDSLFKLSSNQSGAGDSKGISTVTVIIIVIAAVVLAGTAVSAIIIIKHKRKREVKK